MSHLERIAEGCYHDPFTLLGAHFHQPAHGQVTLRAIYPGAIQVELYHAEETYPMEKVHQAGLYQCVIDIDMLTDPTLSPSSYQYIVSYPGGIRHFFNDPYRFEPLLSPYDSFLFNQGTNYKIYEHLGAHLAEISGIKGVTFRVWAPNARAVSVIGDFSGWNKLQYQMRSLGASGVWELFIPHLEEGVIYKYAVTTCDGYTVEKADPFQFYGELRPKTGSVVKSLTHYQWQDREWQRAKSKSRPYGKPLSIYEVHLGSWRRDPTDPERLMTYKELARDLVPYLVKMGFTHVELMPVAEHPLDESWGYQITAPYSLTSRYGTPEEFMYLVDQCHQHNIGIILDWVPAHFPTDGHSLGRFDGTALYEHDDPRKGYHPDWGTYIYNYGRNEVSNYLIANALFWLDKYHIDGLRVDAVASMLYLDYSREEGEWLPNEFGGRENLEAISFLRHLNTTVYREYPNSLMIAEESTAFSGVSKPAENNGLGFGFKWNMGWMNDTLSYFEKDPLYRKYHHNDITFSIIYAFSENFILPLSHDEVVHGKRSLLNKFPGGIWEKFANQRLLFSLMWLHPGKKLLFMGGEFGQWNEWNCKNSLDWHLLDHEQHQQMQRFVADLNHLYQQQPALWEKDFAGDGFRWLDLQDRENSVLSFARFGNKREDHIICLLNCTPQVLSNYRIGLPENREYTIIYSSDEQKYGGSGITTSGTTLSARKEPFAEAPFHSTFDVGPLCGVILAPTREDSV